MASLDLSGDDAAPRRNGRDHVPSGAADELAGRFALARARFPGATEQVYMDVAGRGLMSVDSRDAIDRHMDMRLHVGADKPAMFAQVERVRSRFAGLIGAAPEEIALTGNTSEGINLIAASLPWRPGDSVVLCAALEHPNNVYPWLNLARRAGLVVRQVPAVDGRVDGGTMAEAVDDSTRVVTVSTVSFAPGLRTDLAPIAAACRAHDALLLVDAAQSVGILHTDVDALGADAIAVSTQKGLLGLYGMGFLYCRRQVAEALDPVFLARFGVDLGEAHEATTGRLAEEAPLRYMPGARRFDVGHPNFLAAAALEPSLELIASLGTRVIEAHVTTLARRLAEGLLALGLDVAGSVPSPDLGHIVSVGRLGQGQHDTAEDPVINRLHAHLREHGVRLSIRRGMLRFSLHLYNDDGDVDRVLALTRRHLDGAAEGRA